MAKPRILVPYPGPDYLSALQKAGADVRTVDGSVSVDDAFAGVDGVLLTGGRDVDPALYGEDRHPATVDDLPGRDAIELSIARRALAEELPLLAICRGVQVLNVAAGGSLVQDIASDIGHLVDHDVPEPRDKEAHPVRVKPGTRLAEALGGELNERSETLVNSRHHQAIANIAPGLQVSAVAPDGLPEGIEKAGAAFCVGVQWHPENFHESGRFNGLFKAFVTAAERRAVR